MKAALISEKHEYHTADNPIEIRSNASEFPGCCFRLVEGDHRLHSRVIDREKTNLNATLLLSSIPNCDVTRDGMHPNEHLRSMRCPECGTKIGVHHFRYPSFACPSCGTEICAAPRYLITVQLLMAILSFAGAYLAGLQWLALLVVGVSASRLLASFATSVGLIVVPPRIERFRLHSCWRLFGAAGVSGSVCRKFQNHAQKLQEVAARADIETYSKVRPEAQQSPRGSRAKNALPNRKCNPLVGQ